MSSPIVVLGCPGERYGTPCAWSGEPGDAAEYVETFVPGLELARSFFTDVVRPILREHFPRFNYAAALIGPGSARGANRARAVDRSERAVRGFRQQ